MSETKRENEQAASLRGKVEVLPLDRVQPNPWNPNRVPEHVMESIRHGFRADGWIVSQALLVWATDDAGAERNVIIDGEHRWRAACDVGLKKGPMVLLRDLPEVEAKALTVKLNQKRGDWDLDALGKLLTEIGTSFEQPSLDFGFDDDELAKLFAVTPEEIAPPLDDAPYNEAAESTPDAPDLSNVPRANVRMVQMFFDEAQHTQFRDQVQQLAKAWECKNVTEVVLEAVRRAHAAGEADA